MKIMETALMWAKKAAKVDEVPVGAVIVLKQKVIAYAHNEVRRMNDPTAHAEILALRRAAHLLSTPYLSNCDIFVTLEPCAMCAQAISLARIMRLYFGAYDTKYGAVENGSLIFHSKNCHHRPEVYGGIMEEQSASLLKKFFSAKR